MATTDQPSPVSRDNSGLWMKMDFDPVPDQTEVTQGDLLPSGETPKGPPDRFPLAPVTITRYNLEDEGADDVFLLPPPPLPPQARGGSGAPDANAPDPRVAVTNVCAGVTKAKENPKGLKRHYGENQSTAVESIPEDAAGREGQMDPTSLSAEPDSMASPEQDQVTLECTSVLADTCCDATGQQKDNASRRGDQEADKESENIIMVAEETSMLEDDNDKHPDETPSNFGESTGKKTEDLSDLSQTDKDMSGQKSLSTHGLVDKEFMGESDDVCCPASDEKASTQVTETNNKASGSDFNPAQESTCGHPELCNSNRSKTDTAEVTSDDERHVDTRSLKYNLTKEEWVRRDSANSEIHLPHTPTSRGSTAGSETGPFPQTKNLEGREEVQEKESNMEEDMNTTIDTNIQQGEQLLHRLQLVQQRQDVQQVVTETANLTTGLGEAMRGVSGIEEEDLEAGGGDLKNNECRFHIDKVEEGTNSQGKTEETEDGSQTKEAGEKVERVSPTMPDKPSHHRVPAMEAENSDDDQSDSGVSADFSPVNSQETPSKHSLLPASHPQASTTKACVEINQEFLGTQSLQRARGLLDVADDPDVLEIPFKASVLPSEVDPCQSTERQVSEQRMQREISQENRRELVMVNQGKIPGGYSKGETRQLKETKMLFEAFQQENTEGPTRHRRTAVRGRIYPSVLERTRSLELLSIKGSPVSRTHSMKTHKVSSSEREGSPEHARSKSPVAAPRDNTRLSPYPKQEPYLRLFKSMDSLNIGIQTSDEQLGGKLSKRNKIQESPKLQENPFFKLRPALTLKPKVEKDIREAKEREEELRRQRCTLYGENMQSSTEEDSQIATTTVTVPDVKQQSKGKLDRIWPPPSTKDQLNSEQTQEPKLHKVGRQKTPLWQRWEAGMTNGQPSNENN